MANKRLKKVVWDSEAEQLIALNDDQYWADTANTKNYEEIEGGGEEGGSSYLVASVELDNEQIKALPDGNFELIAAPGANKYISVIWASAVLHLEDFYTNVNGDFLEIRNGSLLMGTTDGANPFQELAGDWVMVYVPNNNPVYANDLINTPIELGFTNTGNLAGGNAANSLKVTVYYTVVDL